MNRRHYLKVMALSILSPTNYATSLIDDIEKKFHSSWQVPLNTKIELWPSHYGFDINKVLLAIAGWIIPTSSQVVIRFQDGVYSFAKSIIFQHPFGGNISILGNITHPEKCRFHWSGTSDAIYVNAGYVLGMIDGITMEHTEMSSRGLGSAFLADNGGVIFCGPNIKVFNFYYGFQARFSGVIQCEGTSSYGAGDANYFAFNGGVISAPNAKAYDARDDKKGLGSGFVAEYGGAINAVNAVASRNAFSGFTALSNGSIRAYGSRASSNGQAGYYVNTGGVIIAHNATATLNCGQGIWLRHNNEVFEGDNFIDNNNLKDSKLCLGKTSHD